MQPWRKLRARIAAPIFEYGKLSSTNVPGKGTAQFHRNKNGEVLSLGCQLPGERLKLGCLADMPEPLDDKAALLTNEAPHLG